MQFKISVVSITRWMIGWRDSCVKILHNLLGCVTFRLKSSTMVYFTCMHIILTFEQNMTWAFQTHWSLFDLFWTQKAKSYLLYCVSQDDFPQLTLLFSFLFFFFYWCRAASIKHFNTSASLLLYTSFTGQFSGFIKAKLKSIFFFILKLIICAIRRQFREMLIPL